MAPQSGYRPVLSAITMRIRRMDHSENITQTAVPQRVTNKTSESKISASCSSSSLLLLDAFSRECVSRRCWWSYLTHCAQLVIARQ